MMKKEKRVEESRRKLFVRWKMREEVKQLQNVH